MMAGFLWEEDNEAQRGGGCCWGICLSAGQMPVIIHEAVYLFCVLLGMYVTHKSYCSD